MRFTLSLGEDIRPAMWKGRGKCDYHTALPILTSAFTAFIEEIRLDLPKWAELELLQLIINACNPDYIKRGDPDARKRIGSPIGIDTFISRFYLVSKACTDENTPMS